MKAQPGNRTSALVVPYPIGIAAEPLRIVPATSATQPLRRKRTEKSKNSTLGKTPDKKRSERVNKALHPGKTPAQRTSGVKNTPRKRRKKMAVAADESALPQLVPAEAACAVGSDSEVTPTINEPSAPSALPALVMSQEQPVGLAPVARADASPEQNSEELYIATESDVLAADAVIVDPSPTYPEKQPFLTALALQWTSLMRTLTRGWMWLQQKLKSHQVRKRLRVCETVPLGDKRFIAVIQVDGEQFLIGGSSNSLSTLAHLDRRSEFSDVFRRCEQGVSQA